MTYQITDYSFKQASKLGVQIKPSKNKKKKIDVFRQGEKIASIGASGYGDYPTYTKTKGKTYAEERRKLYKLRHAKNSAVIGSNAFYANRILW